MLTVALAAVLIAVGGVAAAAGGPSQGVDEEETADPLRADAIVVDVDLRADGAAAWSIQYKYRLDSPNRTRGFERLRDRIEANEGYASDVRRDVQRTVRIAENDTGREMAVRNLTVSASRQPIPQEYGVVVHRFVWDGFAVANGSELGAGDAIHGFWLRPGSSLTVSWPAEYEVESLDPEPTERDDRTATWDDPSFGPAEPEVVLVEPLESSVPDVAVPGLALVTVVGALVVIRRRPSVPQPLAAAVPRAGGGQHDATGTATATDGGADGSQQSTADAPAASDSGEDEAQAEAEDVENETAPLSNEEQLRRVLGRNGGRVKQQQIAERCDWSDSKTSRVVRSLEQQGDVDVYRIGRENVVTDPEVSDA